MVVQISSEDGAKQLQLAFDSAHLSIRDVQARFNSRVLDTGDDADRRGSMSKTPDALAAEVLDYMSFMSRLKFQYLEHNAKDKYVKTIVNDEAPMVTADINADLQATNLVKKARLKASKSMLSQLHSDTRNVAPLVGHDYLKAKELVAEVISRTQSILDVKLAATRLRQAHPSPRLTIPAAEEQLSSQIREMQMLEDRLQSINRKVALVKDAIKERTVKMDHLRSEKAEFEKKVAAHIVEADDGRAVDVCDWYTLFLALHRSLFSLQSFQSISENELKLFYTVDLPNSPAKTKHPHVIVIVLLFLPNTRQLADVCIDGLEGMEMINEVDSYFRRTTFQGWYGMYSVVLYSFQIWIRIKHGHVII
ncbi:hypothetical protein BGW80DRAFT_1485550 [Lactifluus volemus]|nr:hypothetical protein BGW80DRAFT_1485550 [Lactifluus volemus]